MKYIDISTKKFPNVFAIVDDKDFIRINSHKWCPRVKKDTVYAVRTDYSVVPPVEVRMHREVLRDCCAPHVDHRDSNGLNNQRHNLRPCRPWQNAGNMKLPRNNTSGYKGVGWDKQKNKWRTRLFTRSGSVSLGHYFCIIKAAKAYNKAAIEYFGEFANTNLIAAAKCKENE